MHGWIHRSMNSGDYACAMTSLAPYKLQPVINIIE